MCDVSCVWLVLRIGTSATGQSPQRKRGLRRKREVVEWNYIAFLIQTQLEKLCTYTATGATYGGWEVLQMRKHTIGSLTSFSMLLLLLWIDREKLFDNNCYVQRGFEAERWYGVVIRKFIDANDHSLPILTIRSIQGDFLNVSMFRIEHIYDEINLGDTISKQKGSNDIFRCTNHSKQLLGTVDFGCNDPE